MGVEKICIPATIVEDGSLSAKAKGILCLLILLNNRGKIKKSTINEYFLDGKDSIRSGWDELEKAGYIKAGVLKNNGQFEGWEYDIELNANSK